MTTQNQEIESSTPMSPAPIGGSVSNNESVEAKLESEANLNQPAVEIEDAEPEQEPVDLPEADDEDVNPEDIDLGLDDEDDVDDELDPEDMDEPVDTDDPAVKARIASANARRRKASKKAKEAADRVAELEAEVADLKTREIDDDSIREYQELKERASKAEQTAMASKLQVHYDKHYRAAVQQALDSGEDPPAYDGEAWVAKQLRESAEQPLTRAELRQELINLSRQSQEAAQAEAARVEKEAAIKSQRESFVKELKEEAAKDPAVRVLARGILNEWEASGRKGTAKQLVSRLTAAQRKAATLSKSARAERARRGVPLKSGDGRGTSRKGGDPLARIEQEQMEPAALIDAITRGDIDLGQ